MRRILPWTLLLVPVLAMAADPEPRFAALREHARPVEGLGAFLDSYIGECADSSGDVRCKDQAAAFRKASTGKRFFLMVDEPNMLQPGTFDEGRGELTVNLAPFFAAGGYAITHGAPRKTDRNGNPVVMFVPARGAIPDGWNESQFRRLFATRGLRAEVVFTPQGVWSLPKKGGGKLYGVKAKVEGVRITVARTGEQVALWLPGGR